MKKIKDFLIKNNFDYFLLPNSDEFFSEYLPQNQKKIEFICGFTGSSATIIFGQKKSFNNKKADKFLRPLRPLDWRTVPPSDSL